MISRDRFEEEKAWKILIVDDDREVHAVTQMVLEELIFDDKPVNLLSAFTEEEVIELLKEEPSIALIILDVVIDTETSGLDLVRYIREEMQNSLVRIILRTGQPGMAPESKVIIDYDINDYKEKTELTSLKLRTSIIAALRSYRDIIELDRHKNSLTATEHFLTSIISSISSVLIVIDSNYVITEWNPLAARYFFRTHDEAKGKLLYDMVPDLKKYDKIIYHSLAAKESVHSQIIYLGENKDTVFSLNAYPLLPGDPCGLILLINDVTEKQRIDEQLRRSQKLEALGSLAAGLAHDVNNALGGIMGSISLIDFEKEAHPEKHNEEYDNYLMTIKHSTDRASGMVKQLLSLTKKEELKHENVDLVKILSNVHKVCRTSFDKRIDVQLLCRLDEAYILGDASQLEQVILNLAINGYHAMTIMRPETQVWNGKLTLAILKTETADVPVFKVSIKDTGVGISDNDVEKIFDPFFSTKPHADGTGLGLAIVHKIVSFCNGSINVRTEIGKGTEFILEFPVYEKKPVVDDNRKTADIPMGTGTILLCEDEILMRNIGKKILTKTGYSVITADDGEEAIKIYMREKENINLVILDYQMPAMSGIEVFKELRLLNPGIKALLSSGFKDENQLSEAKKLGILGFLQKPYTMSDLALIVHEVLNS